MDIYTILLYLSIILLVGFLFGKLMEQINMPDVTGYIIAGVLIGPYVLNIVRLEVLDGFDVITKIVLGIIAFQIGTELFLPILKKSASSIIVITLVHAFVTVALVFGGVYLVTRELWLAFALSGLSVASAPAPVMQVIKNLRAKGPIRNTVIPVVGMLDIIAVIIFALFSSIAVGLVNGNVISIQNALFEPIIEILASVGIGIMFGAILGVISNLVIKKLYKNERYIIYLVFILSFVLAAVWMAEYYHLSLILIPLAMGMTFTNFVNKETFKIQEAALSNFGGPFIILFFTIAGLSLSPAIMIQAGGLALLVIGLRFTGKVFGSFIGSSITKCPQTVRKYTGFALLPQAGITIGMLVAISAVLPAEETQLVQAIILSSILIFQIIGPILMQKGLIKAGEARITINKEG